MTKNTVEPWELTEAEARKEKAEAKAIAERSKIRFYVIGHPDTGWRIRASTEEAEGITGHTSFWSAYAQCAHMEYNQAEEEYGLRMSRTFDYPLYDWRETKARLG